MSETRRKGQTRGKGSFAVTFSGGEVVSRGVRPTVIFSGEVGRGEEKRNEDEGRGEEEENKRWERIRNKGRKKEEQEKRWKRGSKREGVEKRWTKRE